MQIGDENVHLVRCVMDEVFGAENFVSLISYATSGGFTAATLSRAGDYILWYARARETVKYRQLYGQKEIGRAKADKYVYWDDARGSRQVLSPAERENPSVVPADRRLYAIDNLKSQGYRANTTVPFTFEGVTYHPGQSANWKATLDGLERLGWAGRLTPQGRALMYKRYLDDFAAYPLNNMWTDTASGASSTDPKVYVVQTRRLIIQRCLLMATDPGDLVLDPTCGSGTAAMVAEEFGRRWVTIDTSRVALALARARLMATRMPYYVLLDSPEGAKREAELTGIPLASSVFSQDVRKGFVNKRVAHVTLKSIAYNPDIREGMSREEIDAAIRRHADTELLYDQPYEDNTRIRVTGPFTVESLSPHRVLTGADDGAAAHEAADGSAGEAPPAPSAPARDAADFVAVILENLRKAGVQNTVKQERLVFDRIEPYAGTYVQAVGEYTGAAGKTLRAAISIGPEYGTVDSTWVKEAAKEARQGEGFPLLVVCAFAFGPYVGEEARQWGNLTILITRMNPDLAMDTADQKLLKSTGAGNLFMVFGEPDLELRTLQDGKLQVELRGLDVYDPTTGEIRSDTTDEIACWLIDTDYNEESFFVRHAYFTGAGEPYKKLQRALRAEIDEAAWLTIYSTVSRAFEAPSTGKIAVKVINHYGDEVLKVYASNEAEEVGVSG